MELSVEAEKPPWARQLKRRGFYFERLVDSDDVETILEGHRRDTVTSYGTSVVTRLHEFRVTNFNEYYKTLYTKISI